MPTTEQTLRNSCRTRSEVIGSLGSERDGNKKVNRVTPLTIALPLTPRKEENMIEQPVESCLCPVDPFLIWG